MIIGNVEPPMVAAVQARTTTGGAIAHRRRSCSETISIVLVTLCGCGRGGAT
jgi:hypothetical protein